MTRPIPRPGHILLVVFSVRIPARGRPTITQDGITQTLPQGTSLADLGLGDISIDATVPRGGGGILAGAGTAGRADGRIGIGGAGMTGTGMGPRPAGGMGPGFVAGSTVVGGGATGGQGFTTGAGGQGFAAAGSGQTFTTGGGQGFTATGGGQGFSTGGAVVPAAGGQAFSTGAGVAQGGFSGGNHGLFFHNTVIIRKVLFLKLKKLF